MQTVDERVFTSIENHLANSETVGFAKGKAAALEEMNAEAPESDAVTALEEAVDDYYSTIQKNILVHWETQISQIHHHVSMARAHADVNPRDWFNSLIAADYTITNTSRTTFNFSLVSGETYEVDTIDFIDGDGNSFRMDRGSYMIRFTGGSSNVTVFDPNDYHTLLGTVSDRSSSVKTKLGGFIGDLYFEYGAGDIPTEDVIDQIGRAHV